MSRVFLGVSVKDLPRGPSGDCFTCACKGVSGVISSLFASARGLA